MTKEYLIKRKTLTGLVSWMNSQFKKQTNTKFTTSDVQNYIKRGYIPEYLGKHLIERDSAIDDLKLYNIVKNA
jgi:hypothetical protein